MSSAQANSQSDCQSQAFLKEQEIIEPLAPISASQQEQNTSLPKCSNISDNDKSDDSLDLGMVVSPVIANSPSDGPGSSTPGPDFFAPAYADAPASSALGPSGSEIPMLMVQPIAEKVYQKNAAFMFHLLHNSGERVQGSHTALLRVSTTNEVILEGSFLFESGAAHVIVQFPRASHSRREKAFTMVVDVPELGASLCWKQEVYCQRIKSAHNDRCDPSEFDPIRNLQGIGPIYSARLKAEGVKTIQDLANLALESLPKLVAEIRKKKGHMTLRRLEPLWRQAQKICGTALG
eukprot:c8907_g1_i2.p1 GENE.c8907_g1_i2~~c8907_g1_i2.p1  ORF type:complete len:305 (-),score=38.82 c8907_g1_i2:309-1184(-)